MVNSPPENSRLVSPKTGKAKRLRWGLGLLLALFVLSGFIVPFSLRLNRVTIPLGLPDPVRVAVLGDFHISGPDRGGRAARRALLLAERQKPEAIFLVGDFISGRKGLPYLAPVLQDIKAPLGVYAVLGNHDHWADAAGVKKQLQAAGIRVLDNENIILQRGKSRFALAGIDDLWSGKVLWEKALQGVPENLPLLLLSHNPDAALFPQGRRAKLIISGHTHGGHIFLPRFLHRVLARLTGYYFPPASAYGRAHPYGLVKESWGWVYITSGVTSGYAPPRWFTRPEVAVLELK